MSVRWIPILLIWATVSVALFELLSQLKLLLIDVRWQLSIMVIVLFLCSLIMGWRQFNRDGKNILNLIQDWDDELKQEISTFLQARKVRLLTAVGFLVLIVLAKLLFPLFSKLQLIREVLLYVFWIGLFHGALVSSLILFKMARTLRWIKHENELAMLEKT